MFKYVFMQGEELCFDYGDPGGGIPRPFVGQDLEPGAENHRTPCACKANLCRRYLPFVADLF
jgi:hypothetical protein